MLKKIVGLGLVCLFVAVSFVVAEDDIGPYNPSADVNRDGAVDILDLVEVGQAYGSNYTLMHQANKTTVTVLSFENNNFSYVENALVAVFPQGGSMTGQWNYTDSSGITAFDLSANSSYVAIAWSNNRSCYNYANFATNSFGEALVTIWLYYDAESSPIRSIPKGWIVMTFLNRTTGEPPTMAKWMLVAAYYIYNSTSDEWIQKVTYVLAAGKTYIFAIDSSKFSQDCPYTKPNVIFKGQCGFSGGPYQWYIIDTDEYGGAYVVYVFD